jgi:hypothetical protein
MLALPMVAFGNSNLVFTNAGGRVMLSNSILIGNAGLTSFTAANGTTTTGALGNAFYQTGMETTHVLTSTTAPGPLLPVARSRSRAMVVEYPWASCFQVLSLRR